MLKKGDSTRMSWIPERHAVVGTVISDKYSLDYGWMIKVVGAKRDR
jgi:hypothetical protein